MVIKLGDRKVVDDLSRPRDLAAAAYRTIGPKLFFFLARMPTRDVVANFLDVLR